MGCPGGRKPPAALYRKAGNPNFVLFSAVLNHLEHLPRDSRCVGLEGSSLARTTRGRRSTLISPSFAFILSLRGNEQLETSEGEWMKVSRLN